MYMRYLGFHTPLEAYKISLVFKAFHYLKHMEPIVVVLRLRVITMQNNFLDIVQTFPECEQIFQCNMAENFNGAT